MGEHRQARWGNGDSSGAESLLAEKDTTTVSTDESAIPDDLTRDSLELPDVAEPELTRHYTRLSQMNYSIDSGPYPLGSCTMKHNPAFLEDVATRPEGATHPDRPGETLQGTLQVYHELQEYLGRVGGMDAVSLQPPAGAAGEFAGILVARAYHEHNGDGDSRTEVVVPASAHGTNFASAAMAGYEVVELPAGDDGRVDLAALSAAVGEETAALMLTNPNTLGLFERDIEAVAEVVHDAGGLLYYDGANLNALLGRARPGDMGFDIMHYNVHKTFATPHGGGGPGAGPVGVVEQLAPFLPTPQVRAVSSGDAAGASTGTGEQQERATGDGEESTDADGRYELFEPEHTVGKVHGAMGNWLVLLKAHAYISRLGDEGLCDASAQAVLNANYLAEQVDLEVPFGPFHHEFVASAGGRDAVEFAKGMLDHGVHPPTTKWPEIVDEALMTEPTEAESKRTLDALAAAFNAVDDAPDGALEDAPTTSAVRRVDQTDAARNPRLSWHALGE